MGERGADRVGRVSEGQSRRRDGFGKYRPASDFADRLRRANDARRDPIGDQRGPTGAGAKNTRQTRDKKARKLDKKTAKLGPNRAKPRNCSFFARGRFYLADAKKSSKAPELFTF